MSKPSDSNPEQLSSDQSKSAHRSRKISIQNDNLNLQSIKGNPITFNLGVKPAHSPAESIPAQLVHQDLIPSQKLISPEQSHSQIHSDSPTIAPQEQHHSNSENRPIFGITPPSHHSTFNSSKSSLPNHSSPRKSSTANINKATATQRIWHALEFLSLTAAIFMVFFLAFNFDSYSQLFISKLNLLRGNLANPNPYTISENQILKNASPAGQQPLPILQNQDASKKQIPPLSLEIAPPNERVVIPRIGQNIPVVRVPEDKLLQRDWSGLESQIQDALRHGVVHFPGTAFPGDKGNVVITGHSSYFPWDPGRFKDVFALLHQVNIGDTIIVYHEQKKYEYTVYNKLVVHPEQVDVLTQNGEDKLTLITCTPVGTALNRLVIQAKPKA